MIPWYWLIAAFAAGVLAMRALTVYAFDLEKPEVETDGQWSPP